MEKKDQNSCFLLFGFDFSYYFFFYSLLFEEGESPQQLNRLHRYQKRAENSNRKDIY